MKRDWRKIYEAIYPDKEGYHFYSIIVWEGTLDRLDGNADWNDMPVRIIEARYVIRGQLLHYVLETGSPDNNTWEKIMDDAAKLKNKWEQMFAKEGNRR